MITLSLTELIIYIVLLIVVVVGILTLVRWLQGQVSYFLARHRSPPRYYYDLKTATIKRQKSMWTRGK
jgi:hypothetical protein